MLFLFSFKNCDVELSCRFNSYCLQHNSARVKLLNSFCRGEPDDAIKIHTNYRSGWSSCPPSPPSFLPFSLPPLPSPPTPTPSTRGLFTTAILSSYVLAVAVGGRHKERWGGGGKRWGWGGETLSWRREKWGRGTQSVRLGWGGEKWEEKSWSCEEKWGWEQVRLKKGEVKLGERKY